MTLRFLASRLVARGHECVIVTLTPERAPGAGEVDGIPVRYLPLANLYWPYGGRLPKPLRPLFQALDAYNPVMRRRLRRTLRELRPDVLHCHNLLGFSVSAWAAAESLGIPVVQTLHDYYLACPRSAMWRPEQGNCTTPCIECRVFATPRRVMGGVPYAVTSVSHRVLDRFAAAGMFRGVARARIIRGNNPEDGAAAPAAAPAAAAGAAAAPGAPLRLGFLGRLDPSKGLENLIDALATLPPGAATLAVAGRGPAAYEAALRARAEAAGPAAGAVRFLGHVAPAEFFPGIDLLVIPSVWEDPFPRVFHEALGHGVPSLVSPLGGLPEVIEPGRTGFVAAAATAPALAEALARLLREGWDRAAMRRACLEAARAYAPDRIVGQYEAVLAAAAARAPLPPAAEVAGEPWPRRQPSDAAAVVAPAPGARPLSGGGPAPAGAAPP